MIRILAALAALVAFPQVAGAQEHRVYAGGAAAFATQTEDPLGEQTSTGWFTFRYGVGMRVAF